MIWGEQVTLIISPQLDLRKQDKTRLFPLVL